ncbi:MAG: type II toxin-antitoxin system VapC family toxin [Patescibacteria group bacterium]
MSYLIDTHIFLWSVMYPKKISHKISKILINPEVTKYISVLSFWEISLKFSLGKIYLTGLFPDELPDIAKKANIDILDLDIKIASSYHKLPKANNKDQFDRMIAWQAINYDCVLLTKDKSFIDYKNYGLRIIN